MIVLQNRNYIASKGSSSKPVPVATTVAIVLGVLGFLVLISRLIVAAKKGGRDQEEEGISMGNAQVQSNRDGNSRQRTGETEPEPLPAYEARPSSHTVRPTEVSYDAPAAFELVEHIAVTERTSVAPSMLAVASNRGRLPLMERMAQVQRGLEELNRLMAATPPGGYPPHSIQALKVAQLKQNIALMTEPDAVQLSTTPSGQLARGASETLLKALAQGPPVHAPEVGTLHARMIEVQELLAEIDRVMGQPASLETSIQLQSLRTRVTEIVERDTAPGPSSRTPAPTLPEPVYFAAVNKSFGLKGRGVLGGTGPPASPTSGERGQPAIGEGGSDSHSRNGAIPGPRELPPPYNAAIRDSTDDYAGPGATSVR